MPSSEQNRAAPPALSSELFGSSAAITYEKHIIGMDVPFAIKE
jgi:hypothetical protein